MQLVNADAPGGFCVPKIWRGEKKEPIGVSCLLGQAFFTAMRLKNATRKYGYTNGLLVGEKR